MTPDALFKAANGFSAIGWFVLIVLSPFWKNFDKFIIGFVVMLLALLYTYLNFSNFSMDILKNFGSLEGVGILFQNKDLLLAGWVHILAIDLLMVTWMKKNAQHYDMKHWIVLPAMIISCPFGPLGFLVYLLTRWIKTRKYADENF
jgi:hypothetical protein